MNLRIRTQVFGYVDGPKRSWVLFDEITKRVIAETFDPAQAYEWQKMIDEGRDFFKHKMEAVQTRL